MRLSQVIAPVSTNEFIERYLGTEMLLTPGKPGRFEELLSWSELNTTINRLRVSGPRLRLVQNGKSIDQEAYLAQPDNHCGSLVKGAELERFLADGATLVLDAADDLFPAVRSLAEAFEDVFRLRVQVNMYAGWRPQHGFDLHFDHHDTMILQVHGRKHWKVYRPTRLHPLEKVKDIEPAQPPTEAPVWDGVLENGAVLYMPRGWWHVACPMDESSLHLTVGLGHPTGSHVLGWLSQQLKAAVETRMDIPHLQSVDQQRAWIAAMREHLMNAWSDDVIEQFMAYWDQRTVARPDLHLPATARAGVELTPGTELRLAGGRRLHFKRAEGSQQATFTVGDKPWSCHAALVPALQQLNSLKGTSVADLCAAVAPAVVPVLKLFLTALAMGAVVSITPDAVPDVRPSDPDIESHLSLAR